MAKDSDCQVCTEQELEDACRQPPPGYRLDHLRQIWVRDRVDLRPILDALDKRGD